MKWYQLDKKDIINYLLLSMLSLLYILPIVLINLYFKDDLGWSLRGSIGLKGDGRPLGEYLVLTLCGGEPVTDTAPLPLVLAVLFLSYTLILYARTNLDFISNRYALLTVMDINTRSKFHNFSFSFFLRRTRLGNTPYFLVVWLSPNKLP